MNLPIGELTTIIAAYGAILATLGFALSLMLGINEIKKQKPKVKVKFSLGRLIDADGTNSEILILIEAHNTRTLPVIITGFGFLEKKGNKTPLLNPYLFRLPLALNSHRKVTAYYACRWFRENRIKNDSVGFYFADEEGNLWKVKFSEKDKKTWENAKVDGYMIEWDQSIKNYYRKDY
jgi:hypothetical protein